METAVNPNRSKQQHKLSDMTGYEPEAVIVVEREKYEALKTLNAELLAALKTLYSEFKAYRPDCFEAAEKAALESPDMVINDDGSLRVVRGSTVMIVLNARRAIAKCEGR